MLVVEHRVFKVKDPKITIGKQYTFEGMFQQSSPKGFSASDGLIVFTRWSMTPINAVHRPSPVAELEAAKFEAAAAMARGDHPAACAWQIVVLFPPPPSPPLSCPANPSHVLSKSLRSIPKASRARFISACRCCRLPCRSRLPSATSWHGPPIPPADTPILPAADRRQLLSLLRRSAADEDGAPAAPVCSRCGTDRQTPQQR